MATDRELLELAAKAAGHAIHAARQADRDRDYPEKIGLWLPNESTCWNPLSDDGHALRLAVKLGLVIFIDGRFTSVANGVWAIKDAYEEHASDPYAATRRAIVRVAAAIGAAPTVGGEPAGTLGDGGVA
jgi:hypothetical protein